MNYLCDTHVFLWSIFSPHKISKKIRNILIEPENIKYLSIITIWKISLKYRLGKIDLKGITPEELLNIAKDSGFEFLNIEFEIIASFYKLPLSINKDPFDRMLVWQAINKNYWLLSKDQALSNYKEQGLKVIW